MFGFVVLATYLLYTRLLTVFQNSTSDLLGTILDSFVIDLLDSNRPRSSDHDLRLGRPGNRQIHPERPLCQAHRTHCRLRRCPRNLPLPRRSRSRERFRPASLQIWAYRLANNTVPLLRCGGLEHSWGLGRSLVSSALSGVIPRRREHWTVWDWELSVAITLSLCEAFVGKRDS